MTTDAELTVSEREAWAETVRALEAQAVDLRAEADAARVERDAAAVGVREGLAIINRAAAILDVDWERLDRDDLLTLLSRALSFLHNGPEMVRACVVGSIPRSASSPTKEETETRR